MQSITGIKILFPVWALFAAVIFLTAPAAGLEPFIGEITADEINIRADSTSGSPSLAKADKGLLLEVTGESYDWYKIRLPRNVPCFVKKEFVGMLGPDAGVITDDNVNIRFSSSESALIIGRADKNEPVVILGEENGWFKIIPVSKSFGWVHKKFVGKSNVQALPPAGTAPAVPAEAPPAENALSQAEPAAAPDVKPIELKVSAVIPENPESSVLPEAPAPDETAKNSVTLTGLVKSYGKVLNRRSSHKLITKDNRVFLLKDGPAALKEMVLHTVRVTGRIVSLPKTKFPVIEVEKIDLVD